MASTSTIPCTVLSELLPGTSVKLSVRTQCGALAGNSWTAFHNGTCLSWAGKAATLDVELYSIEVTSGGPFHRTWTFEAQRSVCGSTGAVNVASALPQDICQIAGYGATIAFSFRTCKRSSGGSASSLDLSLHAYSLRTH